MTDFPKIWFLRHGQTEWNLERRLQGGRDSPLTPLGVTQAETQAQLLAPELDQIKNEPVGLFVSPLGRALQTAQIALAGREFVTDDRLSEIGTGLWEGRLRDDVTAGSHIDGGDLMLYASAPQGEGFDRFEARILAFLNDLEGPSVIVSHGLLGKVLRGLVQGLDRDGMDRLNNLQGCVYVLENGTETCLMPDERPR